MKFTIAGKFQPYTRRTFHGRHSGRAKQYHASQNAIMTQIANQMALNDWHPLPPSSPLVVRAHIVMPGSLHRQDIDNQGKALIDAAQGLVFHNDLWVDELYLLRELGDEYVTRFEVTLR